MMSEDNILIENYLKGLLSDKERKSFEERLKTDLEFYKEYKLEKELNSTLKENSWSFVDKEASEVAEYKEALKKEHLKKLGETLSEVSAEFNSKSKKPNRVLYYLAAASIVVFLGIQLFFNQNASNEDLYYTNVSLDKLPSFVTRDSHSEVQLKLVMGEQQFRKGNYQEALNLLETVLEDDKTNSLLYTYVGLAQTELGLYEESEKTFNDLIVHNSQDAPIAYWYKALICLKSERIDEALEQLTMITQNPDNDYYENALKLTENIRDNSSP